MKFKIKDKKKSMKFVLDSVFIPFSTRSVSIRNVFFKKVFKRIIFSNTI